MSRSPLLRSLAGAFVALATAATTARSQAIYEPYTAVSFAGAGGYGSNDGPPNLARFNGPAGLAVDSSGNVYVGDSGNYTLRKIAPDGNVTTLAGTAGQRGTTDGQGAAARFWTPRGVALDGAGNIYVVDDATVRKVTAAGAVTTVVGGTAGSFASPTGIAAQPGGTLYVADTYNHTIRKITANGAVTTFAGTRGLYGNADGIGGAARFYYPQYVAVDGAGNVYVSDGNNNIRKITPDAMVTTIAGGGDNGIADGTGAAAHFRSPQGIAVNSGGNIYVCDSYNHSLRKISPAGVTRTLIGLPGEIGDADGTATQARLGYPTGLAVDSSGVLYLSDSWNNKIRRALPGGPYPTPAPSPISTATPFPVLTPSPTATPVPSPNTNPYLDFTFRGPRLVLPATPSRVRLLASGKFLVFRNLETLQNRDAGAIVRYHADGSYDSTFRCDALNTVLAVTELPNQQLLVAGFPHSTSAAASSPSANQVLRLNSNGSLDTSFASDAVANKAVTWMTLQPDGKILVTGNFTGFAGAAWQSLVRLLPSGALDTSFLPVTFTGGSPATAPVVQPDGRIILGGSFTQINGTARSRLARLNSNGSLDTSFAPSGFTATTTVGGVAFQANGQVVVAGRFTVPASFPANSTGASYAGVPLLRLNPDGTPDGTFGCFDSNLFGSTFLRAGNVVFDAQSRYLALVTRATSTNTSMPSVVRFNTNGTIDPTFHQPDLRAFEPGFSDFSGGAPSSLELESSGSILVAGVFNSADSDGIPRYGLIRLDGDGTPTPFAPEIAGYRDYPNYVVRFSDASSWAVGYPYYGRNLGTYSTFPHNLVRLTAGGQFDFNLDIAAATNDPRFVAFGARALPGDNAFVWGIRGDRQTRNYFRISSSGSVDPSFGFDWSAPPFADAAVLPNGRLLLSAGADAQANAYGPVVPLAADGSVDRTFQVAPLVLNKILVRSGESLVQVNAGTFVVATLPNGQIVLQFLGQDGLFHLSRLNPDGSFDASFSDSAFPPNSTTYYGGLYLYDPIKGGSGGVNAYLADDPQLRGQPLPDGSIVVVGHFNSFKGATARGIMRLLPNGAIDESFNAGVGAQWTTIPETGTQFPAIEDIVALPNGDLLIVGDFEAFDGVSSPGIARIRADGSLDASFAPPVHRLMARNATAKLFPQADGSVMLSGPYSFAGEEVERSLVRLRFDQAVAVIGALSRQMHGSAGAFDIPLPLTGLPGVECRSGGTNGQHTLIVTFGSQISAGQASVTVGTATISGSPVISGNAMTIVLTEVADAQTVSLALSHVTTTSGQSVPDATLSVAFLLGDANGDRVVNSGDATQTRNRSGQETNNDIFRSDINADGFVNSGDTTLIRARSGQSLP